MMIVIIIVVSIVNLSLLLLFLLLLLLLLLLLFIYFIIIIIIVVTTSIVFRSEQERLKHRARQAEDYVTGLRRQLDDRSREVEQLTTLSLKGDATLQEYMAQLTVRTLIIHA